MAITRIYVVASDSGRHLVRAASQAQAIRHIVSSEYTAEIAKAETLVELISAGVSVQDARADNQPNLFGEELGA